MRAMTFERLCHEPAFAGEVTARVAGWSGLARPSDVVLVDCHVSTEQTLEQLTAAAGRTASGTATLLHSVAVPYPGFDHDQVTAVKPDLVVVAAGPAGPVLITGDVKDYERIRSRIDDGRLLKGFLQVAMGSFAFGRWSSLPSELRVSEYGFLAVPRSVFLQPAIEVELLRDHMAEVQLQWEARISAVTAIPSIGDVQDHVAGLPATFDPDSCRSCSLFGYCRDELRCSPDPRSLLTEIGVPAEEHAGLLPLVTGGAPAPRSRPRSVAQVRATVTSTPQPTGQRRIDPAGLTGTVNLVAVKSDAAALGCHGVGLQRVTADGPTDWKFTTFADPQSAETRRKLMNLIGRELEKATNDNRKANQDEPDPVHLVVPDGATADLLASAADLMAGVELSRLRWQRDQQMGRPLLTYNGEPATMPSSLEGARRSAVSFLLEHDRARMLQVRTPIVDLTSVITRHLVPGGSAYEARRLDYLVEWATTSNGDHRSITDAVDQKEHTPGARLSNVTSDRLHQTLNEVRSGSADSASRYDNLVLEELRYKAAVVDQALSVLGDIPDSKLRAAYRSLEGDAQRVWRRRKNLRASDLVRFGRTYRWWRNRLVSLIAEDDQCAAQVWAVSNALRAAEQASDAGNQTVAWATVESIGPTRLRVESRRFGSEDRVVLLAVGDEPWLERDGVDVLPQRGTIRVNGFCIAPLETPEPDLLNPDPAADPQVYVWRPPTDPGFAVGDRLVIAKLGWFRSLQSNKSFNIARPVQDNDAGPKDTCTEDSYAQDADGHRWCCRPHDAAESEFADDIALRRSRRELNPEVWPPVRDADGFEVPATGKPTAEDVTVAPTPIPAGGTVDDLD